MLLPVVLSWDPYGFCRSTQQNNKSGNHNSDKMFPKKGFVLEICVAKNS